jgi:hypothetical protein
LSFEGLNQPLADTALVNSRQLEKHLAAAFYPIAGYGYGRPGAQSTPQGSVFAGRRFQALVERYQKLKGSAKYVLAQPLTLIDNLQWHPKQIAPNKSDIRWMPTD